MILKVIRAAVGGEDTRKREAAAQALVRIRERVPEAHREQFDQLLAEAQYVYRVRDERGFYGDLLASGLARRAILAAGERLVAQHELEEVVAGDRRIFVLRPLGTDREGEELFEHLVTHLTVAAEDAGVAAMDAVVETPDVDPEAQVEPGQRNEGAMDEKGEKPGQELPDSERPDLLRGVSNRDETRSFRIEERSVPLERGERSEGSPHGRRG